MEITTVTPSGNTVTVETSDVGTKTYTASDSPANFGIWLCMNQDEDGIEIGCDDNKYYTFDLDGSNEQQVAL